MRTHRSGETGAAWAGGALVSAFLTALLLAGVVLETRGRDPAEDPTLHHQRVSELAKSVIPFAVGDWFGRNVESAPAAVKLLHPNAMEGRAYVNSATGEVANLLFVQCSDARDILGHFPPVCYPAHGMSQESAEPRDWDAGGMHIPGMRYRFAGKGTSPSLVVDNFMILPTGTCDRDMESVQRVAKDRRLRQFGAAQVQVLTEGTMSDARRDEVFRLLIASIAPLIQGARADTENASDR